MKRIDVSVQFTGTVAVLVPDHLSTGDARLLANKLALAEADWDLCEVQGVSGKWITRRR